MYLALTRNNRDWCYILRQSYPENDRILSRDLFSIGPDPARFIVYPGGNAFYIDPAIEESISDQGITIDPDVLEDIFWPYVTPDIRQAVSHFRQKSSAFRKPSRLTRQEEEHIRTRVHAFDKRRIHYLKFGNMDQGPLENMPQILFRDLMFQSRDEIEQHFLMQEGTLKSHELKSYIFTIMDLQRFFEGFMAKTMPQALDQNKVDAFFLQEICRINHSLFNQKAGLHGYLIRYAYLFFDTEYAHTTLLDDMTKDFIFRHRSFRPPPPPEAAISIKQSCQIFNIDKDQFKTMTLKGLTRHYRKLARKCHPDKGGSHMAFIDLCNAYQRLSTEIKSR